MSTRTISFLRETQRAQDPSPSRAYLATVAQRVVPMLTREEQNGLTRLLNALHPSEAPLNNEAILALSETVRPRSRELGAGRSACCTICSKPSHLGRCPAILAFCGFGAAAPIATISLTKPVRRG